MTTRSTLCIEVCVDSIDSAKEAVSGGATRLEVCGNLGLGGGTTPSIGLVKMIKGLFEGVDVMAMVRPRIGDFVYSEGELRTMEEDILWFKDLGITGVVFGVLRPDGTVDVSNTRRMVNAASPLEVCFHRAFDMTRDPLEALADVASVEGITRILTSGHGKSAPENVLTLSSLAAMASTCRPPITILPGSGINVKTFPAIANCDWWKASKEVHLSGGTWVQGPMVFRKENMGMGVGGGNDWSIWYSQADAVRRVKEIAEIALES